MDEQVIPLEEFCEIISRNVEKSNTDKDIEKCLTLGKYEEAYSIILNNQLVDSQNKIKYRDICAAHGVDDAQYNLALSMHNNYPHEDMMTVYMLRLAGKGYTKAYYYAAICFYKGFGVEKDFDKAILFFLKAFVYDCIPIEKSIFRNRFVEEFQEYLDIEKGKNYYWGINCDQNLIKAITIFACVFMYYEDSYAGCLLGKIFLEEKFKLADAVFSADIYRRCCLMYSAEVYDDFFELLPEYKIGMMLYDGIGIERNHKLATCFLGKVAEHYMKQENMIPQKFTFEINNAIDLYGKLYEVYGYDYEEEGEEWLNIRKKYSMNTTEYIS